MGQSLSSLVAWMSGSTISYGKLNSSAQEFRLLFLQPALLFNDPVEARLEKRSLAAFIRDPPANVAEAQERENLFLQGTQLEYFALSYTWGDPTLTRSIMVNGCEVTVTANLESALRHIRMATREMVLWVDAVCINQNDETEKTAQVRMMQCFQGHCLVGRGTTTHYGLSGLSFGNAYHLRLQESALHSG
jgi:hypothetical protein